MLPQPPQPPLSPEQQKKVDKLIREGFPPMLAMAIVARGEGSMLSGGEHRPNYDPRVNPATGEILPPSRHDDVEAMMEYGAERNLPPNEFHDEPSFRDWLEHNAAEAGDELPSEMDLVDSGVLNEINSKEIFQDKATVGTAPWDDNPIGAGGLSNVGFEDGSPDTIGPSFPDFEGRPSDPLIHKYNMANADDGQLEYFAKKISEIEELNSNPADLNQQFNRHELDSEFKEALIAEMDERGMDLPEAWRVPERGTMSERLGNKPKLPGETLQDRVTSKLDAEMENMLDTQMTDGDWPEFISPEANQRYFGMRDRAFGYEDAGRVAQEQADALDPLRRSATARDSFDVNTRSELARRATNKPIIDERLAKYGSPDEQLISMYQGRPPGFDPNWDYSRSWSPDPDFAKIYSHGSENLYRQNVDPRFRDSMVEQTVGEPTGNEATKLSAIEAGIEEGRMPEGPMGQAFAEQANLARPVDPDELFRTSRRGGLNEAWAYGQHDEWQIQKLLADKMAGGDDVPESLIKRGKELGESMYPSDSVDDMVERLRAGLPDDVSNIGDEMRHAFGVDDAMNNFWNPGAIFSKLPSATTAMNIGDDLLNPLGAAIGRGVSKIASPLLSRIPQGALPFLEMAGPAGFASQVQEMGKERQRHVKGEELYNRLGSGDVSHMDAYNEYMSKPESPILAQPASLMGNTRRVARQNFPQSINRMRSMAASTLRSQGQASAYKNRMSSGADRAMTQKHRNFSNVRKRSQLAKNKSRLNNRYSGGFRK